MEKNTRKKFSIIPKAFTAMAVAIYVYALTGSSASASIKGAMSSAGLNTGQTSAGFFKDLNSIVITLMVVGGIWAVAFIIIGAMRLSASGGNPQKRTEGIIALICAAVGAFIVYKAYDIASWATTIGAGTN